jgi:integrase
MTAPKDDPRKLPAGIRLHHGRYQVRYRDPSGTQRAQSFNRLTDARDFLDGVRTDMRRGMWVDPDAGRIPFRAYAEEWLAAAGHLRPGTREKVAGHLRTHIRPAFGDMHLNVIRPSDVRAWVAAMTSSQMAPGTVIAVYRTFARIMSTALIEDLIPRTPCIGVDLPRERHQEMRFLDASEVVRLADAIDERYRTLVYFAAYTGLRWGELAALKVDRLNLLRGTVDVVDSLSEINGHLDTGPTKTGGRRTVSLPRFLSEMVGEHLGRFPGTEGHVFTAVEGGPLRRAFYRRHFLPAVARAGLEPLRFHDLRHTCASLLIAQGAHAKEIAERLGHSTVRLTLDRYGHLLPSLDERLRDGLEATFHAARSATDVDQLWTKRGPGAVVEARAEPG